MPTTSNFGWTTPADTDLVKDGAAAIRTLGNGIDTSFLDLKGGTTGQILSKNSNTDLDFVWIANDQGDITAVTAGTGISGGGTSGAVTITNAMATEITASGDIIVGTGSGTFDNLPIGTTGQVLTADTTVSPYKVKWATPTTNYVGALAYFFSSQNLTSGANTILTFANEGWDTNSFHDNSTNTSRMTIPANYGGKYLVQIVVCVTTGTDTTIRLLKNGGNISSRGLNSSSLQQHVNTGGNTLIHSASFVIDVVATDYLEAAVVANATSKVVTDGSFSVTYLGA
jgi:hypothetical protein